MKIFTIGFTKTTAQHFFERIARSGTKMLIDVRLNNVSQLAGFAKRDDLKYFSSVICGIPYRHLSVLAPTQDMLSSYKKNGGPWSAYEDEFLDLMAQRKIESLDQSSLDGACLLCSEDKPHHCHRRLVAEYLKRSWPNVEIHHL
ncbi:DUF488 domain-containing protein [Xanthomonas campestris pv. incanae]|uniref:DUF488 domain-containing protein n=1 Tax=Xanthomonas campestris TaxID=339 RepID=UPI0029C21477|nr:DUF488 domain-containing protein [Xanthomonas campestris]MDX6081469.1 DUF488 domain-containing protein [Xanthomonas campestris pv. incanae]MDX6084527.1 DUF488 domain-containing protein [Xanthomonas campestris pv. incanae]MDX6138348.1 DUF488 domain-containing protein [Xanthomonas campestris pv. incanae]